MRHDDPLWYFAIAMLMLAVLSLTLLGCGDAGGPDDGGGCAVADAGPGDAACVPGGGGQRGECR